MLRRSDGVILPSRWITCSSSFATERYYRRRFPRRASNSPRLYRSYRQIYRPRRTRHDHFRRRDAFFRVNPGRNAITAIIRYGHGVGRGVNSRDDIFYSDLRALRR